MLDIVIELRKCSYEAGYDHIRRERQNEFLKNDWQRKRRYVPIVGVATDSIST